MRCAPGSTELPGRVVLSVSSRFEYGPSAMGATSRGLSRRSFVVTGAVGVGALALRPRRTVADVLDARSPVGLWGVARTEEGLVGLWSSGGRPAVVRLSDRGAVKVERILAVPAVGGAVAIAAGGAVTALGAAEEVAAGAGTLPTDHLAASVRDALVSELDGPLSVAGLAVEHVLARTAVARRLDGSSSPIALPPIPGAIAASVLQGGGSVWSVLQHPPTAEGDHCSSFTVSADGQTALEVTDLGSTGPAVLTGPVEAPLVSVADGSDQVRAWRLGADPLELVGPGAPDEVALHVTGGRPIALLASPDGATLLGHGPGGWEVLRDVAGTAGCRRVLAVAGVEPAFLVEVADGVRLVDGEGSLR